MMKTDIFLKKTFKKRLSETKRQSTETSGSIRESPSYKIWVSDLPPTLRLPASLLGIQKDILLFTSLTQLVSLILKPICGLRPRAKFFLCLTAQAGWQCQRESQLSGETCLLQCMASILLYIISVFLAHTLLIVVFISHTS